MSTIDFFIENSIIGQVLKLLFIVLSVNFLFFFKEISNLILFSLEIKNQNDRLKCKIIPSPNRKN